ncbi:thiamine-phosphate kinase [Methanocaldococcus indicus]|uniref:thiamine-phosphate kinase n=1 Tax=Methanocaldococcus indicus TaxID=213231 RepID=UPI003C6CD274
MDELKIIEIIKNILKYNNKNTIKGIGDDCAIINFNNKYLALTTDTICRKTHIPDILTPYQIGVRVLTANISDLVSCGAKPLYFLLSIVLSKYEANEDFIKELYKGLYEYSEIYKCPIIGGDTVKGYELVLSGFALGECIKPLYRCGNAKDKLVVTNNIGRVYCALYLYYRYKRGKISKNELEKYEEKYKEIFKKLRYPRAKIEFLKIVEFVRGACDISDGLAKELKYFKSFYIYSDKLYKLIPEDVLEFCEEFNLNPIKVALNSGEEFEILFTTNKLTTIKRKLKEMKFIEIGEIIENGQFIDGEHFNEEGYIYHW